MFGGVYYSFLTIFQKESFLNGSLALLVLFGIAYSCVVYCHESLLEYILYGVDILECKRTLAVGLAVDLLVNYAVYHRTYVLLGILLDAVRSCLNTVGHHKYRLFACGGHGTRVCEECLVNILVGVGILVRDIEITGL